MFRLFKPFSYFPFLVTILACLDQYPDPLTLLIWIFPDLEKLIQFMPILLYPDSVQDQGSLMT
jgi:hypothetical protein